MGTKKTDEKPKAPDAPKAAPETVAPAKEPAKEPETLSALSKEQARVDAEAKAKAPVTVGAGTLVEAIETCFHNGRRQRPRSRFRLNVGEKPGKGMKVISE